MKVDKLVNVDKLFKEHERDVDKGALIALVVRRGKVIAIGYNRKCFPIQKNGKLVLTKHAEEDALDIAGARANGADIIVLRKLKDMTWGLAKPCHRCAILLDKRGIAKRTWSTPEWNL